MDHLDLQGTLEPQEAQARRETKEKMAAQGSPASWVPVVLRESQERKESQARRVFLGGPEKQDPKEKGEIPGSKVTRELLVGRVSQGTLGFQATKATQA